jgi:hypothetical protein
VRPALDGGGPLWDALALYAGLAAAGGAGCCSGPAPARTPPRAVPGHVHLPAGAEGRQRDRGAGISMRRPPL